MTDEQAVPLKTDTAAPVAEADSVDPTPVPGSTLSRAELDRLTESIVGALSSVYDPEIPVDIYNLGLIYRVDVDDDRKVDVTMTLTTPMCPVAGEMPGWVQDAVASIDGVQDVAVELTFDPPWHPGMVTQEGREHFEMVMGYPLPGG